MKTNDRDQVTVRQSDEQPHDDVSVDEPSESSKPVSLPLPRRLLVAGLIATAVLLTLLAVPIAGATLSVLAFVAFVPVATDLSTRLVVVVTLLCGVVAGAVVLSARLGQQLDLGTYVALVGLAGMAAVPFLARVGPKALLPRVDAAVLPLLGTTVIAWLMTGATLVGRSAEAVMGGLAALGWDHQSHFSIFADAYNLGGVWTSSSGVPEPSFSSYPPLAGVLASMATLLVDGERVPNDLLLSRYAQTAALMAALSLGLFAWLSTLAADALHSRRRPEAAGPRWIPAVTGLVVGGYLCIGPPLSLFDYGFSNFLLAAALAVSASWIVLVFFASAPVLAALLLALTVAAVGLLWPPLLLLAVPAGVITAVRVLRSRKWGRSAVGAGILVTSLVVPIWQARRLAPGREAASGLAETLGAASGGMPPVPLGQAVAYIVAALGLAALTSRGQRASWLIALAPAAGGAVLLTGFILVSLRAGAHPQHAYYAAKAGWALFFAAVPLLGSMILVVIMALARLNERPGDSRRSATTRPAVAALAVTALVWSSLASVNVPGSKSGFVAVPPAFDSVLGRWNAFRGVDAGNLVFLASRAIGRPDDSVPVLWDGGDLKLNRWLASLRQQLSRRAENVYNPMPGAPYEQPAVDALTKSLTEDPSLQLSIAYFRPETRALLRPLAREFPGRVRLVLMS